jgi:hypothetical protein
VKISVLIAVIGGSRFELLASKSDNANWALCALAKTWRVLGGGVKGPAADATDAPQP